ncbi:hypothetical protein LTS15_007710 [Exophiala xenobiotica]|nr:hypothetical protein LTS15_007710 [Exophiala xenobiotica]
MSPRPLSSEAVLKVLTPGKPEGDLGVTFILIPSVESPAPAEWAFASPPWLTKAVPSQYQTRVLAFEYYIQVDNGLTWQHFQHESLRLLHCLEQQTSMSDAASQWPIIVVCHCLGGLILKKALHLASFNKYQYGSIFNSISGIIFLGTPHCQNNVQELSETLDVMLSCYSKDTLNKATLSSLHSEIPGLCETARSFRETTHSMDVLSCYERLPTKVQTSRTFRKVKEVMIISKQIAAIGARDEMLLGLPFDHLNLPRLHHHDSSSTAQLSTWVSTIVHSSLESIAQKIKSNEIGSETTMSDSGLSSFSPGRREWLKADDSLDSWRKHANSSTTTTADLELMTRMDSLVVERKQAKLPCFMLQTFEQNSNFHGREDVLSRMDEVLLPSCTEADNEDKPAEVRCVTLHGPPGIGKTEIAVQYAYTRRDKFDAVFWIHADDIEKVDADFAQITIVLELENNEGQRNPVVSREIAKEWLSNPIKDPVRSTEATWLIIFDNADDPDLVADYVQNLGNGALLVTTRDPDAKDLFPSSTKDILVDSLSPQEGAALLRTLTASARRKPDKHRSLDISEQLDGFPLAITQMAFYIRNKRLDYTEFLDTYADTKVHEQLHEHVPTQQRKTARGSIASIWAFDELSDGAKYLLEVLTFMDADGIQESLFLDPKGLAKLAQLPRSPIKRIMVLEARGDLISSSLIRKNEESKTWRIHRLLQDTILARLLHSPNDLLLRFRAAVLAVLSAWPETSPDKLHAIKHWQICKRIYPHVLSLRDRYEGCVEEQESCDLVDFATLLNRAAWWQYERGDCKALKPLAELALRVCKTCRLTEAGHRDLLSDVYYTLGAYGTEANDGLSSLYYNELFLESRLAIHKQTGVADDRLGKAYNQLGISKMMSDEVDEAIELFQKALFVYRPLKNAQFLAMPMANLGLGYWLQGKYALAVSTLEQGIKERVELHGPNDTESFRTGRLLHAMGNVKENQGLLDESEMFHRKALTQYQSTIGDDHHRTSDVRHRIARHCLRKGELKQARKLIDQALKVWNAEKSIYRNEIARTTFLKACLLSEMNVKQAAQEALDKATDLYAQLRPKSSKSSAALGESDYDQLVCFWSR